MMSPSSRPKRSPPAVGDPVVSHEPDSTAVETTDATTADSSDVTDSKDRAKSSRKRGRSSIWQFSLKTFLVLVAFASLLFAWYRDHRHLANRLEIAEQQLRGAGGNWGVEQMLGPPNTPGAGDIRTAWASATQDGQKEWIELTYEGTMYARQVVIHETYNPGAVYRVTAFDSSGREHEVWQGKDPTPTTAARGVSKIDIRPKFATKRIRVYLDSPKVAGWNEIDAVGLRDSWGRIHWASKATASSDYSRGQFSNMVPMQGSIRLLTRPPNP